MTKSNFNSKKFAAFIFSMLVIAGILITSLLTQTFGWAISLFACVGILAISIMSIAYVNNQATLDKFIEAAKAFTKVKETDVEDN